MLSFSNIFANIAFALGLYRTDKHFIKPYIFSVSLPVVGIFFVNLH